MWSVLSVYLGARVCVESQESRSEQSVSWLSVCWIAVRAGASNVCGMDLEWIVCVGAGVSNGFRMDFGYFGSQVEQEQAMYVEWIGTIVCVGSQTEHVRKECVWVRGQVWVGSQTTQEWVAIRAGLGIGFGIGSQVEQDLELGRKQSRIWN